MSIEFLAKYEIRHPNGSVQTGSLPVMAPKMTSATILASEQIKDRCGRYPSRLEVRPA